MSKVANYGLIILTKTTTGQVVQLDRTAVKVVGEMEDVLIRLSTDETVCQYIDIVVADIPDAYGLVLNIKVHNNQYQEASDILT